MKIGDRVIIKKTSCYYNISRTNPDDSVHGTVMSNFRVLWDNGTKNGYGSQLEHHLELVKIKDFYEIY